MTWTWDPDLLVDGDADGKRLMQVRSLIGDTDSDDEQVTDEEIGVALLLFPPTLDKPAWLAAAHVCDMLAGKYARAVQRSIGPISRAAQQAWEHYRDLAAQLRLLHATDGKTSTGFSGVPVAAPVLGGGGRTYLGGKTTPDPYGGPV